MAKSLLVGFQGESGAYSELAAREYFGENARTIAHREFEEVFLGVTQATLKYGVIPIENSLAGSIHQNYDLLLKYDVTIVGETRLKVNHQLMALPGSNLQKLRQVYSHPQALAQCSNLFVQYPHLEAVPYFDTAGSARFVAGQRRKDIAAIASLQAAKECQLKILKPSIQNNEENFTRFLIIGQKPLTKTKFKKSTQFKTSIVFALQNIPGGLYKSLSVFALRDIDLLKIESRPLPGSPWQYLFYLDFIGAMDQASTARAVEHLAEITKFIKILGSYPLVL